MLKFNLDESVWLAKQRVLSTLVKEIKDGRQYKINSEEDRKLRLINLNK